MIVIPIAFLLALFAYSYAPDAHSLERNQAEFRTLGLPDEAWVGFGLSILGVLWGESVRAVVDLPNELGLPAYLVNAALLTVFARDLRQATSKPGAFRASPLLWISIGLFPSVFFPGNSWLTIPLDQRSKVLFFALFSILCGGLMWLADRSRETSKRPLAQESISPTEHPNDQ